MPLREILILAIILGRVRQSDCLAGVWTTSFAMRMATRAHESYFDEKG